MKNFYSTLILLLILNFSAIAQIKSNYERGFEIGFKEGYCYNRTTYDCFTPMTPISPMPRINESRENYTEGYNRGFQYGLDLKRSNDALRSSDNSLNQKVASFNRYVPQNPVEAMRVVGMIRQQKYDARTEWLQQKAYQFTDLYNSLFNAENFPVGFDTFTHKNNLRNIVVKYFDDIKAYDFGDDYVFRNVQLEFNNIENYYYTYYNSIVSQIKQRTEKETIAISNSNNNYADKQSNENTNFSGILKKHYGKYSCAINEYELVGNKYILKETKDGKIDLYDNIINFSTKDFQSGRKFLSQTLDNKTKECTYKTEYGNVVIDYDFRKITFYNLDNKSYYVYIIKDKI